MKREINRAIIYFILGIVVFINMGDNILLILLSSMLLVAYLLGLNFFDRSRKNYYYLYFLIFIISIFLSKLKFEQLNPVDYLDKDLIIDARVISQVKEDTYILRSKNIILSSERHKINRNIKVRLDEGESLSLGSRILFKSNPFPAAINSNPKLYNHRSRLLSQEIFFSSRLRKPDLIKLSEEKIPFRYRFKDNFNKFVRNSFLKYLEEDNAELISGIILGDYSRMDPIELSSFRDTGLAHILAVSGLHISIISTFILKLFSFLGLDKKLSMVINLIIIWIYAYLINFPISILRSNIVISVVYLSRILEEPNDPVNSLILALFIILLKNPFYLINISFQLSFLASLSIILLSSRLAGLLPAINLKILDSIWVILSIQLGLFPLQAYYFNKIITINIISNIVLLPFFSLALILALMLLFFELAMRKFNQPLGFILQFLLNSQRSILAYFQKFTSFNIRIASPDLHLFLAYYSLIFIILKKSSFRSLGRNLRYFIIRASIIFIISISISNLLIDEIYIDLIDVGQGDSILISADRNRILIDTGGEVFGDFSVGENITLPYLIKHNIFSLKALIITHFHDDHSKAAPLLLDELDIENTFISYDTSKNPIYKSVENKSKNLKILKEGDIINLARNKKIRVLSPGREFREGPYSENDMSLSLLLEAYGKKLLFTGDIEAKAEGYIMDRSSNHIKNLDLLKVAHHGSKTSSSQEFVDWTNPKIAIFTVGTNNSFGHPHDEVLDRYIKGGSRIYRTDQAGRIRLIIDKETIEIQEYKKEVWGFRDLLILYRSFILAYLMVYMDLKDALRKENQIELYRF